MRHELGRDEKAGVPHGHGHHRRALAEGRRAMLDTPRRVEENQRLHREDARWTWTGEERTGCTCSRTRRTTIRPKSSRSAAQPPAWRAIRDPCRAAATSTRPCASRARRPLVPVSETLPGKLPQRKLVTTAAAGIPRYGNQIGLAPGQVERAVPPGYVAKRMEIGAVVWAHAATHVPPRDARSGRRRGAAGRPHGPRRHRRRHRVLEGPQAGSARDCGAEVQKGNAPVERKLQRLFRRSDACKLIKRCNDFGRGRVRRHRRAGRRPVHRTSTMCRTRRPGGLDGTERAISESQERMARCHWRPRTWDEFIGYAHEENLEAKPPCATVTEEAARAAWVERAPSIVDVSRDSSSTATGAAKAPDVRVLPGGTDRAHLGGRTRWPSALHALVTDLNVCSKQGPVRAPSTPPSGGLRCTSAVRAGRASLTCRDGHWWRKLPVFGEDHPRSAAWPGASTPTSPRRTSSSTARTSPWWRAWRCLVGRRLLPHGHVPDVPRVHFEKQRDEPEPAGASPPRRRAGRADGAGGPGYRLHRGGQRTPCRAVSRAADVPPNAAVSFAHGQSGAVDRATSPEFKHRRQPRGAHRALRRTTGVTPAAAGLGGGVRGGGGARLSRRRVRRWPCPRPG